MVERWVRFESINPVESDRGNAGWGGPYKRCAASQGFSAKAGLVYHDENSPPTGTRKGLLIFPRVQCCDAQLPAARASVRVKHAIV